MYLSLYVIFAIFWEKTRYISVSVSTKFFYGQLDIQNVMYTFRAIFQFGDSTYILQDYLKRTGKKFPEPNKHGLKRMLKNRIDPQ